MVEVLIASTLAAFVMVAVMSAFLFLGRSGANIQNYTDMEAQGRKALEIFAQDVRQASAVSWTNANTVTLVVDGAYITYSYSGDTFSRSTAAGSSALVTGVTTFSFKAYNINGAELNLGDIITTSKATKQLQISLEATRASRTVATATNLVLSARFILRNKRVTA
jgi:hypothetical protein